MHGNLRLQSSPIPTVGWCDAPHVKLELTFGHRRALVGFVMTVLLGEFHGGLARSKVDGFKDVLVELTSRLALERQLHHLKRIRQPLHANSNRSVPHIACLRLLHGIKVAINHPIQILGHHSRNVLQLVQIKAALSSKDVGRRHKFRKADTGEVTHSNLVRRGVLYNFSAEIGTFDGTQILLVRFTIAMILVQHVRRARLHLRVQDGKPQLLRLNSLASLAITFILFIKSLKLITPALVEPLALVGAHERPLPVALNTFHKEIGDPEGVE
mmetsp:Transcript_22858/g.41925  ORF Transcript_22858/g.41925 Transcript_22858/m.41925 type:complete len:270 (-) Transcript_22858:1053-1862(-)